MCGGGVFVSKNTYSRLMFIAIPRADSGFKLSPSISVFSEMAVCLKSFCYYSRIGAIQSAANHLT